MSNDVISQLRTYLDFASGESVEETMAAAPSAKALVRWYQRGPVLAVLAGLLVLAVGVPALLLSSNAGTPLGSELPEPLDVGVERVWPDAGFVGGPNDIASEFAEQALGWMNVETVSDPDATPDGPVWTTIRHAGSPDLEVLSVPIGDGRRVLMQVGSSGHTVGPSDEGVGQRIGIPRVPTAESAILHIRFIEPDRVEVIPASRSDLEQGQVDVASDSLIGGIVVVYLDERGEAVTSTGGHFGPFASPPAPEGSSTTLAEGSEQASWPGGSGFEPGDPRLFFPTIVVDKGIATLEVLFLDGSSVEMEWPSDLDLVSGGLRPYSVAYMMSLQGDHGIFRDLTVERGDVVEMATRIGAPDLVASYPDGRGGSVGYWSGGQESGGVRHLSYQFGGWALLVPDWPGAGGMSEEEREIWAMHLHGEETEDGLLRLTLDQPLRFAYDWMTVYLESPGGTVTLDLAECSPTYEEAFEQTQIWCDESGHLIVQVTGDKDFRERVRADLDLVAIDPSDEFGMREEES